jgi:hypothetical protein
LKSGVAICSHPDGQQTEDGDQAKGGNTKSEGYLDKRKSGRESLFHRL